MIVVVPCLGRPTTLPIALAAIRERAGCPIDIRLVVDGDPGTDWHAVAENQATGAEYADSTIVLGSHKGNGAALQAAVTGLHDPYVKVDADVVPNEGWLVGLVDCAANWDDGKLGCLIGLPHPENGRANVGPRRYHSGRRLLLRIALFTTAGAAAIADHTTTIPINGHDKLVAASLHAVGLWQAYCHAAWVDQHLTDPGDAAYDAWKAQYLTKGNKS